MGLLRPLRQYTYGIVQVRIILSSRYLLLTGRQEYDRFSEELLVCVGVYKKLFLAFDYCGMVTFETIIFIATGYKIWSTPDSTLGWSRRSLTRLLWRDGLIYYGVMFFIHAFNFLTVRPRFPLTATA